MDTTTLDKANSLNGKIKELTEALNCFEWPWFEGDSIVSTNPRLIIEFDDEEGGRTNIKLSMVLNEILIDVLKSEIKKERDITVNEFNQL